MISSGREKKLALEYARMLGWAPPGESSQPHTTREYEDAVVPSAADDKRKAALLSVDEILLQLYDAMSKKDARRVRIAEARAKIADALGG